MQNAAGREAGGRRCLFLAAAALGTPKWGAATAALPLPHVCSPQPLLTLTKPGDFTYYINSTSLAYIHTYTYGRTYVHMCVNLS